MSPPVAKGDRKRAVTMNDVAAAAGVAQSTVSRVLNEIPTQTPVSPQTRERVRAVATALGYRPHPIARALRGAPTMLLGAVVRDITDPFFAAAIEALSIEAKERGYSVVLGHARAKADEALALTAVLEARQCDAIVLLGDFRGERRLVEDLRSSHVRVVGLWHGAVRGGSRPFPTVGVDNRAGVWAVMEHLVSLGHRRIAFVGEAVGDMRERQAAYTEFLNAQGLDAPAEYVRLVPNSTAGGGPALTALLAQEQRPTAVVAGTDPLAMGLIHAAYEHGVSVPGELSVAGFDDIALASATVPPLTTVHMPIDEIVAAGIELAVGEASGDGGRTIFQPRLVVRASTAAAPAG